MKTNTNAAMRVRWDIRRQGRAWGPAELRDRLDLTPEKFEVIGGKLFWSENERVNLLGLLLENVGVDVAVGLGSFDVWEAAIAAARNQLREEMSRLPVENAADGEMDP